MIRKTCDLKVIINKPFAYRKILRNKNIASLKILKNVVKTLDLSLAVRTYQRKILLIPEFAQFFNQQIEILIDAGLRARAQGDFFNFIDDLWSDIKINLVKILQLVRSRVVVQAVMTPSPGREERGYRACRTRTV